MRKFFVRISIEILLAIGLIAFVWPPILYSLIFFLPIIGLGFYDMTQRKHSVLRNFPVIGHFRYILEEIRPEIQQYFVESNASGRPFSREMRSVVYQRAKKVNDTVSFGTQFNVYEEGYEWINHSISPLPVHKDCRITIGGPTCKQLYAASIFNISGMSYGSLSQNAILALNKGAKEGNFFHNTGEGGITPYHTKHGGDLVWQLGTAYFGCRKPDGTFDPDKFAEKATQPHVKMIDIKLSQGAKPGHGGILPAAKLTPELAKIRDVPMGHDVISPPKHSAFTTPLELLHFITQLRKLSNGKPVGFKLCLGKKQEFLALTKAMLETKIYPDFITVDGGEGGTGAAPLSYANSVGTPLYDGLSFIHDILTGANLRPYIRLIASGKVITGFDIATKLALGADIVNSARGMMFALGCIQALRCNTNQCPTGVATQDPDLTKGLDVKDKSEHITNYHAATVKEFFEILGTAGFEHPSELSRRDIMRRINATEVKSYEEIYPSLPAGCLVGGEVPETLSHAWKNASAERF